MKIAILGGGNVYALNFARHLSEIGVEHFGIGRSGPKAKPLWQVEHHYRFWALHLVDQLDAYLAILDTEKPDVVVNFAAQGEGAASFGADAHYYYTTNTVGLVRLVDALRQRDYVKRFLQIGSSEVYGSVDRPVVESDELRPTSPYAVSKAAFDQHLQIMHRVHGFAMNIVRPSNAYCPGQQLHRIIPKAIICALAGQKLQLHGGGRSEKSYIHADDLSRGIVTVLERGQIGATYNCGPQRPTSIKTIAEMTASACGTTFDALVEMAPERQGQDGRYWIDSSALKGLGWKPVVDLERGIVDMVEWVKTYPELLTDRHDVQAAPVICFVGTSHAPRTLAAAARTNGWSTCEHPEDASLIFISEDTPTDAQGVRDLEPITKLIWETVKMTNDPVVLTSQVPPGFTRALGLDIFCMAETLRMKDADARAISPEQFIIGVADPSKYAIPVALADYMYSHHDARVLVMSYEEAEMAKIAINMMLAAQVEATNRLSKAAAKVGARWDVVAEALRADRRIGPYSYLTPGRWQDSSHLLRDHVTLEELLAR